MSTATDQVEEVMPLAATSGITHLVQKPSEMESMLETVADALAGKP